MLPLCWSKCLGLRCFQVHQHLLPVKALPRGMRVLDAPASATATQGNDRRHGIAAGMSVSGT